MIIQELKLEDIQDLPSTDKQISDLKKKLCILNMTLSDSSPYRLFVSQSLVKLAAIADGKEAKNG